MTCYMYSFPGTDSRLTIDLCNFSPTSIHCINFLGWGELRSTLESTGQLRGAAVGPEKAGKRGQEGAACAKLRLFGSPNKWNQANKTNKIHKTYKTDQTNLRKPYKTNNSWILLAKPVDWRRTRHGKQHGILCKHRLGSLEPGAWRLGEGQNWGAPSWQEAVGGRVCRELEEATDLPSIPLPSDLRRVWAPKKRFQIWNPPKSLGLSPFFPVLPWYFHSCVLSGQKRAKSRSRLGEVAEQAGGELGNQGVGLGVQDWGGKRWV